MFGEIPTKTDETAAIPIFITPKIGPKMRDGLPAAARDTVFTVDGKWTTRS